MTLVSIVIVLLIEQVRALPVERAVLDPLARLAAFLEEKFNDGGRNHGTVAWGLGVALPAALLSLLHGLLLYFQPLLAFLLGIGVLYLTMGFRQFSHYFTGIHLALRQGDNDQARKLLAQWRRRSGDRLTSGDIARLAIERRCSRRTGTCSRRCSGLPCWARPAPCSTASPMPSTSSGAGAVKSSSASSASSRTRPSR
jgi:adenosylcobinamide-phosphate synthase